ncbi:phosphotransferase [Brevibacterium sp. 5221]|uniref:Phosphotransferase n=1 Tax=Brevibacterium rongguiense TaxID=2695267 RepID=A0A6N9H604_9MICO|nr:phosphotransferase family protein [Brevibacterium rongguiense]MYM19363.1 phosphotransferase [Brevibacterium rongguiense]
MTDQRLPAGIEPSVVGWISDRFDAPELGWEVLSVGRSNLTYVVTVDGQRRWVLRRPPLGHAGGSAHDVAREGRIMQALGPTDVPTVTVLDIVNDPAVLDVPFVFQDYCAGFPLNDPDDLARIPEAERRRAGFNLVDALAAIHRVDVDAVGLGDLRRPGSLIERQLRRWLGQFRQISMREIPAIEEVHDLLLARMPDAAHSPTGLCHGDYKPNNLIWADGGDIRAVVDWELSAVGEVLSDLGYLIAMLTAKLDLTSIWVPRPGTDLPSVDELVARYEEASGITAHDIDYYQAFALWKLACIREGVYTRLVKGQMGDLDIDVEAAGAGVEELALQARALLGA